MSGTSRFLAVLSVAVLGFSLNACELNEECDPNVDPNCEVPNAGPDTADTDGDTGPVSRGYFYVLVEDYDNNASGDRPGADIDAIELQKHGSSFFVTQIHELAFGGVSPDGANANINNAMGAPQGQCIGQHPEDWDPTTFVSLGGNGGYLIGSFGDLEEIEAGDQLTVHACAGAGSETWDASVGVASTLTDPNWFVVIDDAVDTFSVTVPTLPVVAPN